MNTLAKVVTLTILVTSINIFAFADTRIRFAKGRTSATVTGRVPGGGRICYLAGAGPGQQLTATVISRSGRVVILESGETSYNHKIEIRGDQSVCVDNLAGGTTYSLTLTIR